MTVEGVPGAKDVMRKLIEFSAASILRDSTAVRLRDLARVIGPHFQILGVDADLDPSLWPTDPFEIDVRSFGRSPSAMLRSVSQWSAKSAAAFHAALDSFDDPGPDVVLGRYGLPPIVRTRMASRVLDSHAFDEGNQKHIELLESFRSSVLSILSSGDGHCFNGRVCPYSQVDSGGSYLIQAADIAAGIASHLFGAGGLVRVVHEFEYVSYNGARISLSEAEEQQRRN